MSSLLGSPIALGLNVLLLSVLLVNGTYIHRQSRMPGKTMLLMNAHWGWCVEKIGVYCAQQQTIFNSQENVVKIQSLHVGPPEPFHYCRDTAILASNHTHSTHAKLCEHTHTHSSKHNSNSMNTDTHKMSA